MEKNINIAELLKDCPKGTKLYSPLCGECELYDITNYSIKIKISDNDTLIDLFHDGTFCSNGECMLYPSKGTTTWEGFVPFVAGDVIYTDNFIAILSHITEDGVVWYHCYYYIPSKTFKAKRDFGIGDINYNEFRLATEEEKQKLFQAIKDNGYEWNPETKTLKELPKFKVGDRIILKDNPFNIPSIKITAVTKSQYILENEGFVYISSADEKYVLEDKFNITTLKPFDKVLTRANDDDSWVCNLYSHRMKDYYVVLNAELALQCIPYEQNEHLLGTTDDCDEFYKTWE